jgi:Family of unknown function (DUF6065)
MSQTRIIQHEHTIDNPSVAENQCRLSLRERLSPLRKSVRGAKDDFTLNPAHVAREARNLNHAKHDGLGVMPMSRPVDSESEREDQFAEPQEHSAADHASESSSCPRCQALEARIAELEATVKRGGDTAPPAPGPALPRVEFKALRLIPSGWGEGWQLRPSPPRRHWMDELPHAYKCLPLVIANQWGWQILCPTDVIVTWDGDPNLSGLHIDVTPQYQPAIKSQFGTGIVTFSPPWLFRTPPGWDLYAKGPSNRWKPNCVPLEGVIETWWLNYTFTLNWKLVEPGTVFFARGESLGQLVPVPHATFHESTALEAPIGTLELRAAQELLEWQEKRRLVAGQKVNVHHLYRKAEGIEEHLQSVNVPPIEPWDRAVGKDSPDGTSPAG